MLTSKSSPISTSMNASRNAYASSLHHLHHHQHQPFYAQYGDKVYSSTFPRPSRSSFPSSSNHQFGPANQFSHSTFLRNKNNIDQMAFARSSTLPYKTLSADNFSLIDRFDGGLTAADFGDYSSGLDLTSYCDFHCSSLHREGGSIKVSKSVGTSPILELFGGAGSRNISPMSSAQTIISTSSGPLKFDSSSLAKAQQNEFLNQQKIAQVPMKSGKKGHVRFMGIDKTVSELNGRIGKQNLKLMNMINGHEMLQSNVVGDGDDDDDDDTGSSDDTETTACNDDEQLCERYLLLVDRLSTTVSSKIQGKMRSKHLSIKDIGIILERLKSKIIDVDKLERDRESYDCYHWLIKGLIRGEMLREIGVLYNGQYYSLMEHPGYF
ncbi:hypothetical protein SSS_08723 [Sarcoptes scabiei]|uniref:Uncharacterized protein n=1 Tax=Sarcoptes scabiei TaxID=52283 RepID=A0A834RBC1_SARSC|nr:hypothetical protein SSS_08723 [Sarcoptes scabiei]